MSIDGKRFGAMDLYRDTPGELDEPAMEAALVLTNVAAAYLHYAHDRAAAADSLDQVRHQSLHDPLTGLPNRTLLSESLEGAVARAVEAGSSWPSCSSTWTGSRRSTTSTGTWSVTRSSSRWRSASRARCAGGDTVARLSGDEFVVVCEELNSTEDAG